jgi:hypothetical protein
VVISTSSETLTDVPRGFALFDMLVSRSRTVNVIWPKFLHPIVASRMVRFLDMVLAFFFAVWWLSICRTPISDCFNELHCDFRSPRQCCETISVPRIGRVELNFPLVGEVTDKLVEEIGTELGVSQIKLADVVQVSGSNGGLLAMIFE